ncbi:MAG: hypothetical protein B6V02_00540 [Thermoprotei archaeon ex4572_64]|nr:MAG: hypothetical protein B6V02_00540 [Thermoprotei archaeon ex4572_64]
MSSFDVVKQLLVERDFEITNVSEEFIEASYADFKIKIWFPKVDYLDWYDPLLLIEAMGLDQIDALVIVSYRPYYLADEIARSLSKAKYWYGVDVSVGVYAIDESLIEKQLEEALGLAFIRFIDKVSNIDTCNGVCPQCFNSLRLRYIHKHVSRSLGCQVIETILICYSCGVKIHRVEIID